MQLSAKQLSTFNRLKLINIISKLSKIPAVQKWNGIILYGIFKRYAPEAVRQCYRTLWRKKITRYSLINYGLNDPSSFLIEEKMYQDKSLYQQVKFHSVNLLLKMYTNKTYNPTETMFAKPVHNKQTVKNEKQNVKTEKSSVKNEKQNVKTEKSSVKNEKQNVQSKKSTNTTKDSTTKNKQSSTQTSKKKSQFDDEDIIY